MSWSIENGQPTLYKDAVLLRGHARRTRQRPSDVAQALVTGEIDPLTLRTHSSPGTPETT
jgi:hypothetical protein